MRVFVISVAVLLLLPLITVPLIAQTVSNVRVTVPFTFIVANQTMESGDYVFSRVGADRFAKLLTTDRKVNIGLIALEATDHRLRPASFVFNKYGDRYFLAYVYRSDGNGWFVLKCKIERELVTSRMVAKSQIRLEEVAVLAWAR